MSQDPNRNLSARNEKSVQFSEELEQLLTQLRQACYSVKEWAEQDLLNQLSSSIANLSQCEVNELDEVKRFLFPDDKKICYGEITDVLFKLLKSDCLDLRRSAVQIVKLQPALLIEYISPMLYHIDVEVRKLALELVQFCEHDEARYWLHGIMLEDQSEQMVGRAVEALAESGDSITLQLLNRVAARYHYSDYIQFATAYTRQVLMSKFAKTDETKQ